MHQLALAVLIGALQIHRALTKDRVQYELFTLLRDTAQPRRSCRGWLLDRLVTALR